MKLPSLLLALFLSAAVKPAPAAALDGPPRHVLFFSRSQAFEHSVIKQKAGQPSYAENILKPLGHAEGIEFTFSKDGGLFTPENIAKYDCFVFYTTGDLTKPGGDNQPPMPVEGKAALLDAIKKGKGFVGVHSATDTFHSPGERYQANPSDLDPYLAMLGGEFIHHGKQQKSKLICADPAFPGVEEGKNGLDLLEEWYSLKNFAPDLHVIYSQVTDGMAGNMYQRRSYPDTWIHNYGAGRVFYTAMGHRDDIWTNPAFQKLLIGGIKWALGMVSADATPNITKACPGYSDIPPAK